MSDDWKVKVAKNNPDFAKRMGLPTGPPEPTKEERRDALRTYGLRGGGGGSR